MINSLLGGLFGKVIENAEGILDEVITTDEEREAAKAKICLLYTSPSPRD